MPNIRQYSNEDNALQPNEGGAAAQARAAIRFNQLGREEAADIRQTGEAWQAGLASLGSGIHKVASVVEDWQTHKELSTFNAALINTHAALDKDWSETRAKTDLTQPAGPDWLNQKAIPELDKLLDGVNTKKGREHAEAVIESAKLHYLHSATADDQTAAGDGVVRNLNTVVDGATLRSMRDFSTVQYNADLVKSTFETTLKTTNLSSHEQSRLREAEDKAVKQVYVAGLKGAADRNPGAFKSQLEAGAFDKYGLGAAQMEELGHYAKAQARARHADGLMAQAQADYVKEKDSKAEANRIAKDAMRPDGTVNTPSLSDIMNSKKLSWDGKKDLIRFYGLDKEGLGENKTKTSDFDTKADMISRMHDLNNPLTADQITKAVKVDKTLTEHDGTVFMAQISTANAKLMREYTSGPLIKNEMAKAEAQLRQIPGGTALADPSNPAIRDKMAQFKIDTIGQLQAIIENGHDPRPYLDPHAKEYMFTPERIKQYQPSLPELQKGIVVHPATPVPKPSEVKPEMEWPPKKPSGEPAAPSYQGRATTAPAPQSLKVPQKENKSPKTYKDLMDLK